MDVDVSHGEITQIENQMYHDDPFDLWKWEGIDRDSEAKGYIMKRLSNKALLVYSVVCLGVLISAISQAASANVGQVQGSGSAAACVGGAEIPDLFVSLDTKGGPVLILFNIQADMTADATLSLRPTIDGQIPDPNTADYVESGSGRVGVRTLSYSRVFNVAKGAHVFGVLAECVGNFVSIGIRPAWLTVYELQ